MEEIDDRVHQFSVKCKIWKRLEEIDELIRDLDVVYEEVK